MLDQIDFYIGIIAGYVDQYVTLPLLYTFGWMRWAENSFDWAVVAVYGLLSIAVTALIGWPLERWLRLEFWPDRRAVRVDILYTILAKVGFIPIASYLVFYSLQTSINEFLAYHGYIPPTLETLLPVLDGRPYLSFLLYALLLDGAEYVRHRLSHRLRWWYALHAVHHAQRQMSFWTDDRNHLLDDVTSTLWFSVVALLLGVPPLQFPILNLMLRLIEGISHANIRLSYGWLGDRLIVSPCFHRRHHAVLAAGQQSCNFAAVFALWDWLFRTADFSRDYHRTGDDAVPEELASGSWLQQQIGGVKLLFATLRPARRLTPAGE